MTSGCSSLNAFRPNDSAPNFESAPLTAVEGQATGAQATGAQATGGQATGAQGRVAVQSIQPQKSFLLVGFQLPGVTANNAHSDGTNTDRSAADDLEVLTRLAERQLNEHPGSEHPGSGEWELDPMDLPPPAPDGTEAWQEQVLADAEMTAPAIEDDSAENFPVDPNGITTRPITQHEMLQLALHHSPVLRPLGLRILDNPNQATTIFDSAITASDPFFGPAAALSAFDAVLSADLGTQNNDRVFNNSTLGGDVQELTQDFASLNAGIQKRSFNGAIWDLTTRKQYDSNNRTANIFPNYWETQLEAGVRQPLLRGAGRDFNLIAGPNAQPGLNFSNGILIARLNNRISDVEFEVSLRKFVADLYRVYWDLKRQHRDYQSVIAARDLAYQTWQSVLARNEAKVSGGEANKEAQARAKYYRYCRETAIIVGGGNGQDGLLQTERQLRKMIGLASDSSALLFPIDDDVSAEFTFDLDTTRARAMMCRAELKRQTLKVQQQEYKLVAAKNFLLPQLDLIGRYRIRGFGDDLVGGDRSRFSSAYKDFFSLDHQEVEFGVEMGVTAGRRQGHAAVRNAVLQLAKDRSILKEQQRELSYQIADSIAEVDASFDAMKFSRLQVDAAKDRLESSEVLFEADKIQIEFLLDAQEELLQAERSHAADLSRYATSLISLSAASGTLLNDLNVAIQRDCQQTYVSIQ